MIVVGHTSVQCITSISLTHTPQGIPLPRSAATTRLYVCLFVLGSRAHGYYRQLQSVEIEIENLRQRVESIELSLDGQSRSKHHVGPTVSSAEGGTVRDGHELTKGCTVAFDQNTPTVYS